MKSIVRAGVCLIGALAGIAATSLYVWILFASAAWFNLGRLTEFELATYGFEAFAIWWATMVSTAKWLYQRLDAPANDFAEIQCHREFLLVARTLVAIGLVGVHVFSMLQAPRAAVGNLVGIVVAIMVVSPVVELVVIAFRRHRQHKRRLKTTCFGKSENHSRT